MNIHRQEIRTGLLVVISIFALVGVVLYLGAPGVFVPQHTFYIYFDNAAGIKHGAAVLLSGRKVGQVSQIFSPVPEAERPDPKFEVLVEVNVRATAKIYNQVRVQMVQTSLLGETNIDFSNGREAWGLAENKAYFQGERARGLTDAVPQILEKIDPVMSKLTETLGTLQTTSGNLNKLTAPDADLSKSFAELKQFGVHLNELSGPESALRKSLANVETLTGEGGKLDLTMNNLQAATGPDSALVKTLNNAERFTSSLANNQDIDRTLGNFRRASERLSGVIDDLGPQFKAIGRNLEQASATVKHQPWRLIWPTTKKYPDDRLAAPSARMTVKTSARRSTK